ncbi:hypothetical protein [Gloeobacter violaceus]|uniref:hypothetical protein n=1 Tax=Gloeobacter violaceus TaxID=33072 RepID=UPI0002F0CCF0|nr:hypothetical protein [Gloeobacter violaceus]
MIRQPNGEKFETFLALAERAEQERQRAERAEQEATRLRERLRQLGVEPDI